MAADFGVYVAVTTQPKLVNFGYRNRRHNASAFAVRFLKPSRDVRMLANQAIQLAPILQKLISVRGLVTWRPRGVGCRHSAQNASEPPATGGVGTTGR